MKPEEGTEVAPVCCAVLVAAGNSVRMGEPKQFMKLLGVPAIVWTLRAFDRARSVSSLVLAVRPGEEGEMARLAREYGVQKPVSFVPGGEERQVSVWKGVQAAPEEAEFIAVHDGARPLVTPEEIDRAVGAVRPPAAAALAVPVKDTIKIAGEGGLVLSTPPRESLWAVQTPQVFPAARYRRELALAMEEGRLYTDDCQLWEHAGLPVQLCRGSYENLKLTTREDAVTAESLLRERGQRL